MIWPRRFMPMPIRSKSDKEGRIILGDMLMAHAGITDNVVFMGTGPTFQIWEPASARRRAAEARQLVNARSLTLPGGGAAAGAPAARSAATPPGDAAP